MCTNVGMMGVDIAYAPLIPMSRVGVIGLVGGVKQVPMVVDGKIEIRPQLTGSATFDHRLGDGAQIGLFIRTVRAFIEDPYLGAAPPAAVAAASNGNGNGGAAHPASAPSSPSEQAKPLPVV
jgi:pyruvate dehydrogenase E2 component (dihydrolipoamide acetyltransferase)